MLLQTVSVACHNNRCQQGAAAIAWPSGNFEQLGWPVRGLTHTAPSIPRKYVTYLSWLELFSKTQFSSSSQIVLSVFFHVQINLFTTMSEFCGCCHNAFVPAPTIVRVSCWGCRLNFHEQCLRMSEPEVRMFRERRIWWCPPCSQERAMRGLRLDDPPGKSIYVSNNIIWKSVV